MAIRSAFRSNPHRRVAGFTAIELMVVITIVGILAALAMPSFRDVIDRYRVRQASEELGATLYFARSEAIKRGGNVTLRKASAPGCTTAGAGDWSCGWVVFVDADNDGVLDAGELALQVSPATRGANVQASPARSYMLINSWGQFSGMSGLSFEVKPTASTDASLARRICMSSGGRLRVC